MSLITTRGYGTGLIIWWVLSIACFVVTALIWRQWLGRGRAATPILLAVCMPAWFWAFAGGQNSFFSLLVLTGFCALLARGRDGWAGLVLSLLTIKYQFLVVPAALLLFKRRWRAVAGLAAGGLAALLLTATTLGTGVVIDYFHFGPQLGQLMYLEGFDVYKQHCWHGFFALLGTGWLPPNSVRIVTLAATLATLAVLATIWRGPWRSESNRFALQLSALLVTTVLTSPHLFQYDTLLLALPAVLWYQATTEERVACTTSSIKTLLAVGFVWLAFSSAVAALVPIQLSVPLMVVWLLATCRALREPTPLSVWSAA